MTTWNIPYRTGDTREVNKFVYFPKKVGSKWMTFGKYRITQMCYIEKKITEHDKIISFPVWFDINFSKL